MKKLFYYSVFVMAILSAGNNANTSLSNLATPTKINANLVPDKGKVRSLGSVAKSWKNIYLDSDVYFRGERFLAAYSGTGYANTAVGSSSLLSNTSGSYNTANGFIIQAEATM